MSGSTLAPAHGSWAQTHSGIAFDFINPAAAQINDADVAHALAHINRFTGHLNQPYSVAQHSLLVLELLLVSGVTDSRVLLQGLVHDTPEFVIGDVSAPLKRLLPEYQRIEARVWAVCAEHYGVPVELDPVVKVADWQACRLEAHAHLGNGPVHDWAGTDDLDTLGKSVELVLYYRHTPQEWVRYWRRALFELSDAVKLNRPFSRTGRL